MITSGLVRPSVRLRAVDVGGQQRDTTINARLRTVFAVGFLLFIRVVHDRL